MLVRLFWLCGKVRSSLEGSAPTPEPHRMISWPGLAEFVSPKELPLASVTTPEPVPVPYNVSSPSALATTCIGAGALRVPLYVTVMVPFPTGVEDGRTAASWFEDV